MRAVEQTAADLYHSDRSTQEAKDEYPESAIDELTSRHADMLLPDGLDGHRDRDLFKQGGSVASASGPTAPGALQASPSCDELRYRSEGRALATALSQPAP